MINNNSRQILPIFRHGNVKQERRADTHSLYESQSEIKTSQQQYHPPPIIHLSYPKQSPTEIMQTNLKKQETRESPYRQDLSISR